MDDALPDLPGFDTASALKMLGNNAKLYKSVLKRFYKQYADNSELAGKLKNFSNLEDIQREAHTLKGLAGTIGHAALQNAAQALELSVKDRESPAPAEVSALAEALLTRLAEVLELLKDSCRE
jgi:HPt (histidine-containing phosphotransfer) domain-containing protein